MKKTLLNITLVSAFGLSTICGWCQAPSPSKTAAFLQSSQMPYDLEEVSRFSHFLGMGTQENLKAYHIGLKALFPQHRIPSSSDLLDSVYSHENFVGSLTQLDALDRLKGGSDPFIIFKDTRDEEGHFYIAHSGGLRHFIVNKMEIASIDNVYPCYPSLNHLLQSTLVG